MMESVERDKLEDKLEEPEYFSFSIALERLQAGKKVAREIWEDDGATFIFLTAEASVPLNTLKSTIVINKEFLEKRGCNHLVIEPHINMWTPKNTVCVGVNFTQQDLLAKDWYVVDEDIENG